MRKHRLRINRPTPHMIVFQCRHCKRNFHVYKWHLRMMLTDRWFANGLDWSERIVCPGPPILINVVEPVSHAELIARVQHDQLSLGNELLRY